MLQLIFALTLLSRLAAAQTTSAVCLPGFEWMFNALQQSPCVVASYLGKACFHNAFNLPALKTALRYGTPTQPQATGCMCSAVEYSMINGCGACQRESQTVPHKWSEWIVNCTKTGTDVTVGSFPYNFGDETQIPAWAYVDVIQSDLFKVDDARVLASQAAQSSTFTSATTITSPTGSESATGTATATGPTTTSAQESINPDSPASPSETTGSGKSAKLATTIAVPIVIALALAAVAGGLVLQRRKQRQRRDAAMMSQPEPVPFTFASRRGDSSPPEMSQWASAQHPAKQRLLMATDRASDPGTPSGSAISISNGGETSLPTTSYWGSAQQPAKQRLIMAANLASEPGPSPGSATADSQAELVALNSAMTRAGLSVHTLLASLPRGDAAEEGPPRYGG